MNPGHTAASTCADEIDLDAPGEDSARLRDGSGRPLRILIVEDDAMVAALLRDILLEAGAEVVGTISSGLASVGAAGVIHPDVVIMDVGLPGMDGIDAADVIRARNRTAVVFISGRDVHAEVSARLASLKGVEMLLKPIERSALCEAIARAHARIPLGIE